jgi:hypothetical protein
MPRRQIIITLILILIPAIFVVWPFHSARPAQPGATAQLRTTVLPKEITAAILQQHVGERVELIGTLDLTRKYGPWINCGTTGVYVTGGGVEAASGDIVVAIGTLREVKVPEPAKGEPVAQTLSPGSHCELEAAQVKLAPR